MANVNVNDYLKNITNFTGKDCKLLISELTSAQDSSGIWHELLNVNNVNLSLTSGTVDKTTRGSGGWREKAPGLKEGTMDFEMLYAPDIQGSEYFQVFEQAYLEGKPVLLAVFSPDNAGPEAFWTVSDFSRNEQLEDAVKASVKLEMYDFINYWKSTDEGTSANPKPVVAA